MITLGSPLITQQFRPRDKNRFTWMSSSLPISSGRLGMTVYLHLRSHMVLCGLPAPISYRRLEILALTQRTMSNGFIDLLVI